MIRHHRHPFTATAALRAAVILLLSVIHPSMSCRAVPDNVHFRNITMEDGLLSNTVRNVVQDRYGFIWMGTDNGLCRYDGVAFQPFRIIPNGVDQYISCLTPADDGLYMGTSKGAYLFDFQAETFRLLKSSPQAVVYSVSRSKEGNIWFTVPGDSIGCYDPSADQTRFYPLPPQAGSTPHVYVDNNNQVWLFYANASRILFRFNKATHQFQPIETGDMSDSGGCYAFLQSHDGTFWLGTWTGGLYRFSEGHQAEQVLNPLLSQVGNRIHQLYEQPDGRILIGCDDGLIDFNPPDRSWHLVGDPDHAGTINNRFVYSILRDTEGGLWFGTFYGGVNYISPVSERFVSFQSREGRWGLQGNVVSRFCEDANGHIWIATDDGGLSCYQGGHSYAFIDFPRRTSFARLNAHALCVEGNDLWIGTYSDGIFRMNISSGQTTHYNRQHGLTDLSCYALFRDSQGTLWAGSMSGMNVFNAASSQFQPVKSFGALTLDIDEDRHGNLWFSTQGSGVWCYQRASRSWKNYRHQAGDTLSLASDQISCICITADHRLWAATESGLCLYDEAHDTFAPVHLDIPSSDIRGIVEDGQYLWLTTTKGIVRYNQERDVLTFNKFDGLCSEQFQPNSVLKASDGRLYFGSVRGFCAVFPYQINVNTTPPAVFITALRIYNKTIAVGDEPLPQSLSHLSQLDLSHRDDMFSLSFAALSYCAPEKNQYAYMLEGFDKDWVYCGNRHEASYTNIPSGTYTFRVRATNNDGTWSTDEAQLKIVVHPPFWLSWPAKLLYLLLALLAIYGYTHFRLRKAELRHQQELQHINDQAEAEVRDARLRFFTMIAHEIRTPVSLIIGPLETIKQGLASTGLTSRNVRNLPNTLNTPNTPNLPSANLPDLLNIIDRNAHRLLTLVNQLLDFNKVQQQGFTMHFSRHSIANLMQAVAERFEPTLQQRHIAFHVDYPADDFTAVVDEEGITKVISNLMTNATKYTHDQIRLSCAVAPDGQTFSISVADNGAGISKEDRKKIFDAFYQARDNKPGTGIGLSIVKTIVDQHDGDVRVESEVGQGARFIVTLPVGQKRPTSNRPTPNRPTSNRPTPQPLPEGERPTPQPLPCREGSNYSLNPNHPEIQKLETQKLETDHSGVSTPLPLREGQGGGSPSSVLIVEDDADLLSFLASHFAQDYTVLTAVNGIEALQQLSQNAVSLIISDWMMPEMDGAEFCRRLRANRDTSHIPLIMLTAKTDDDSKAESMQMGADAFIEKPFSMKYLDACLSNLIERRRELMRRFSQQPAEPIEPLANNDLDNELLTKMNHIIVENMTNPALSVNFLAEQLNISRSGLFSKIKALTDVTPNEMIQVVRLRRAAQLLAEGQYRVNEVCYMVGFSSPSYFSKCFQKQFGKKPGEMMKS